MRLFVSVRPSAEAVAHLQEAVAGRPASRADQWHVTLAFLGEVEAAGPVSERLRVAAARHVPFSLALRGSGSFGRTTWAGVGGDVVELRRLAADVREACRDAGIAVEHGRYRPHLTVGRVEPKVLAGYEGPPWQVAEFELVVSVLGLSATHSVLERFALQGG